MASPSPIGSLQTHPSDEKMLSQTQSSHVHDPGQSSPKINATGFPIASPPRKPLPQRQSSDSTFQAQRTASNGLEYREEFPMRNVSAQHPQFNTGASSLPHSRSASAEYDDQISGTRRSSDWVPPTAQLSPSPMPNSRLPGEPLRQPKGAAASSTSSRRSTSSKQSLTYDESRSRQSSLGSIESGLRSASLQPQLQYHHQPYSDANGGDQRALRGPAHASTGDSPPPPHNVESALTSRKLLAPNVRSLGRQSIVRPSSAYSSLSLPDGVNNRTNSPNSNQSSPNYARTPSASRNSPDSRPTSYIDLLNVPYPQQAPSTAPFLNAQLQGAVGSNASLLSHKQTLEMYRANAKKTNDPSIQYEFAIFMIGIARETGADGSEHGPQRDLESPYVDNSSAKASERELLREARQILQRLSDRSYPFAQYYLGDGLASGLFTKGKPDHDRAFPLFLSASKHGHAEGGYRAALCYEFGWGCRKDPAKAVQFYRQSSSKNHPGAMARLGKACLVGDLGLGNRHREGLKWLKRASESADLHYNSAPYELGVLHESGFGADVFQDETYAAQLFTKAADLGHPEACYRLGDAYEHGKLSCPRDPALSVHFYNGAAQQGHPASMMALCAWYMVGAEPVLDKDENEAYEWARRAAECGMAKAEYAVGYFTEMGIGCRRDPLEANVWYVRAADQGDERATNRLATIRAAASGEKGATTIVATRKKNRSTAAGADKDEKDCIVM
ncbi:MAG: hypothetical protein M1833_002650 [Piccolia ochrophora]|nr:MAG: hypothetical protein M1833_002650 [Piccolia ochrophora]